MKSESHETRACERSHFTTPAPIMISNDRIIANVGAASLLSGVPASLRD